MIDIMKDLSRTVRLHCPVCGNAMFSVVDESMKNIDLMSASDDTQLKCSDCGKIITKRDLLHANEGIISENIENIKEEAIQEINKELKKTLKGIKNINIKL